MKLHDYMMDRLLVPDPKKLIVDGREQILEVFEKVKDMPFPIISEQFKTEFEGRKMIDTVLLKILGQKEPFDKILSNYTFRC